MEVTKEVTTTTVTVLRLTEAERDMLHTIASYDISVPCAVYPLDFYSRRSMIMMKSFLVQLQHQLR